MFELDEQEKRAWQLMDERKLNSDPVSLRMSQCADALLKTLAEVRRLEWDEFGVFEDRSAWTSADWEREARRELEGK